MSGPPDAQAIASQVCAEKGFTFAGELGSGAFKSVFLVVTPTGKAALKVAEIAGSSERFEREIQALRSCVHSSVATVLDAFRHDAGGRHIWIVVEEYLGGGTLEDRLNAGPATTDQVRGMGVQLAQVLGHLHERSLVHRDIKPANILFRDESFDPVLTDFGIVRMLDSPSLTAEFAAQGPGTPAFAAPEQLNNEKNLIDWRTDQFGLAVVLGMCILGHHPYQTGVMSIRDAVLRVASRGALQQESVERLRRAGFAGLARALAPWPVMRYRWPQDFVSALSS